MALRVFISYSHDSPEHSDRVWDLSERLRQDGVDCRIDQHELAPEDGWPRWCRNQIQESKFVLVLCTETYQHRYDGKAPADTGSGAKWEGFVITQEIYDAEGKHTKFIPVAFSREDLSHIPLELRGANHYLVGTDEGYIALLRRITDNPERRPSVVAGQVRPLPMRGSKQEPLAAASPDLPSLPKLERKQSEGPALEQKQRQSRFLCNVVRVFYGTDRNRIDIGSKTAFSGDRSDTGSLNLGFCDISIPATHKTGRLETPKWWKLEFRFDPKKHVTLCRLAVLPKGEFYRRLRERVRESGDKGAFVFVHGFNVSFEDAARRTAQIANDLDFDGAPIMFSWPSCAKVKGYAVDEATIDWVLPHLSQFLHDIVSRGKIHTLHLIAHSMGSRALARVLKDFAISDANLHFNQVLMAAPDVDRGEFVQVARSIKAVSERITLYVSSKDKALQASHVFHGYPRAGDAGTDILVTQEVDTIDASEVDTDFLAHSYFCEDRTLLNDIFYVVSEGKPPRQRYGLDAKPWQTGIYWVFRP
jgi:esterase/lipase superfamily enzyme